MNGPYSPAYSIGGSPRRLKLSLGRTEENPGPASYRTDRDNLPCAPRPTIGKSQRYALTAVCIPGPGQYQMPSTVGYGPCAVLTSRKALESDRSGSPGPANYSPRTANTSFSFSVSRAERMRTKSQGEVGPGPGTYEPKVVLKTNPRPVFGSSKKDFSPSHSEVPGPGRYASFAEKPSGFSFAKTMRTASTDSSRQPPGPGSYNLGTQASSAGVSMAPRRPVTAGVTQVNPGPGSYASDADPLTPSYTIGNSTRFFSRKSTGPAASDYTPVAVLRRPPSFSIGKGKRSRVGRTEEAPGPASYNPDRRLSTPKFTIRTRGSDRHPVDYPGPGQYSPKSVLTKAPITAIGHAKRNSVREMTVPAPNEYDIGTSVSTPRYSFSRSKRMGRSRGSLPGPGQYDFLNTFAALPAYASEDAKTAR